jgi:hypothetical protein
MGMATRVIVLLVDVDPFRLRIAGPTEPIRRVGGECFQVGRAGQAAILAIDAMDFPYCLGMPARSMTADHRAMSDLRRSDNSAGVLADASIPSSSRRARTSG